MLSLDGPGVDPEVRVDLRRQAWALGVAAIDTYLHWLVKSVDLDKPLPKALARLDVPFESLVKMGKASVEARKSGRKDRPMVKARNTLNKRILRDSYQSSRSVEGALSLVNVRKPWTALSDYMGEAPQDLQHQLNALSHRRNAIVHEGDIQRQDRPRSIKRQPLGRDEVNQRLEWIARFLDALDKVAPTA